MTHVDLAPLRAWTTVNDIEFNSKSPAVRIGKKRVSGMKDLVAGNTNGGHGWPIWVAKLWWTQLYAVHPVAVGASLNGSFTMTASMRHFWPRSNCWQNKSCWWHGVLKKYRSGASGTDRFGSGGKHNEKKGRVLGHVPSWLFTTLRRLYSLCITCWTF